MTLPTRLMVVGNCQAQFIEGMIATGNREITVERIPPVFELRDSDWSRLEQSFASTDLIFLQRVSEDYQLEWVRPSVMKAAYPGKVLTWPNIYFDGYFPDARYIYRSPYGKLTGPLEDYHFGRVVEAHRAGLTVEEAVRILAEQEGSQDSLATKASLTNLRQREDGLDVTISDFLEVEVERRQCFYTPNHPHNFVLLEMARRLVERAGVPFDVRPAVGFKFQLDKVQIRPHPPIGRRMFGSASEPEYVGVQVTAATSESVTLGEAAALSPRELVEQFYEVYDAAFPEHPGRASRAKRAAEVALAPLPVTVLHRMRHRRIGLVGLFGSGNFGPELFREALERTLPGTDFVLLDTPKLMADGAARQRFENEVDAVLLGGSDLIIPSTWVARYFADVLLTKPVLLYGVGVPTWAGVDQNVVAKLRRFVQHPNVKLCVTRDVEGAAWIKKNLAPLVPVQCFTDPMCALELPPAPPRSVPPIFTLVTRELSPGEIAWDRIEALCERARGMGYHVRNLVLSTGEVARHDREVLRAEVPGKNWEIVASEEEAVLVRAIAESTVMASMKLQGTVIASMYGIPSIGLLATDKFENFYRAIERPDLRGHHTEADLPDRLTRRMAPIAGAVVRELRQDAEAGLLVLRTAVETHIPAMEAREEAA